MVQKYVLDEIADERLKVFVVWGPMLGEENREDTDRASTFLHDPRSTHFWTPLHAVAETFRGPAGLPEDELAWDTFHLFGPGAEWTEQLPRPLAVMHVEKSLPAEQRLNGIELRRQIAQLLGAGPDEAQAAD